LLIYDIVIAKFVQNLYSLTCVNVLILKGVIEGFETNKKIFVEGDISLAGNEITGPQDFKLLFYINPHNSQTSKPIFVKHVRT
jgi:hypothetical protein